MRRNRRIIVSSAVVTGALGVAVATANTVAQPSATAVPLASPQPTHETSHASVVAQHQLAKLSAEADSLKVALGKARHQLDDARAAAFSAQSAAASVSAPTSVSAGTSANGGTAVAGATQPTAPATHSTTGASGATNGDDHGDDHGDGNGHDHSDSGSDD